ncbi:hypothetical protein DL769_009289 [Monosporascus sp. CRB-8-3]|nr:hypothetical protein DL769_009289 [Monosporascus sp. CRB-8-3]
MVIRTKFLIISDTHGQHLVQSNLRADVAIHCGDLTEESKIQEFRDALDLLKSIQAPLKLVIAGNHDFTMDLPTFEANVSNADEPLDAELVKMEYGDYGEAKEIFENAKAHGIHFLEEGMHRFELENGALLTVYASPCTPSLNDSWGFQYRPQQHEFTMTNVDLVMTHGPPHGIMDLTESRTRAGCPNLFSAVARAQPKLHCFGHIHEGWGAKLVGWRDTISPSPSHFTDIDNDRSLVIEKLSNLKKTKFDTAKTAHEKFRKRTALHAQGFIRTSHCSGDENPLQQGQTIFVNAAIEGTTEEYPRHLPWLVEIELPPANLERDEQS